MKVFDELQLKIIAMVFGHPPSTANFFSLIPTVIISYQLTPTMRSRSTKIVIIIILLLLLLFPSV